MSIVSIRQLRNKVYMNMCNLFTMELNIIVCNVTIRQLGNKVFNNMCDLFILEFNIFVRNVVIRQLGNKTFNNMCNLFTMELNIIVCNVTIRQLRNKVFNNMCDLFILEFNIFVRNKVKYSCVQCWFDLPKGWKIFRLNVQTLYVIWGHVSVLLCDYIYHMNRWKDLHGKYILNQKMKEFNIFKKVYRMLLL